MPKKSARDSVWELLRSDWGNLVTVRKRMVDGCLEMQASVPHTAAKATYHVRLNCLTELLGSHGLTALKAAANSRPVRAASCLHWGTGLHGALPAHTPLLIEILFKFLLYVAYNVLDISDIPEQSVSLLLPQP